MERATVTSLDSFKCCRTLKVSSKTYAYYSLWSPKKTASRHLAVPFSLKVLLGTCTHATKPHRYEGRFGLRDVAQNKTSDREVPFRPARMLMQDHDVPAVVDSLRARRQDRSRRCEKINPLVRSITIDHSVAVNFSDTGLVQKNVEKVQTRSGAAILKWAARSFTNFRVVPPGTGICHQVNLEYLCRPSGLRQHHQG